MEVACLHYYRAPIGDSGRVCLPAGFVLDVRDAMSSEASAVQARPHDVQAWEPLLVPPSTRGSSRYSGYALALDLPLEGHGYSRLEHDIPPCSPADLTALPALRGCLLGTALGDSLGLPFERMPPGRVDRVNALPLSQRLLFGRGMCSDDTEHTCLVAQSLIESGHDLQRFAERLAGRLRWWLLGLPAGVGMAPLRAGIRLWLGYPPARSGVWSAGNGAAMRSAVIGVWAGEDDALAGALVRIASELTHRDPRAFRAARIVARAAHLAASGQVPAPAEAPAVFRDLCAGDEELAGLVTLAAASAASGESARTFTTRSFAGDGGVSGYCHHTVACALQIWLRLPGDFEGVIAEAVSCGGDTDTVAAIVGGIVGAGVGADALPAHWLEDLFEWPRSVAWMEELAVELTVAKAGLREAEVPGISILGVLARNLLFFVVVLAHGLRRLLPGR